MVWKIMYSDGITITPTTVPINIPPTALIPIERLPIAPAPNFHLPEFFGEAELQK